MTIPDFSRTGAPEQVAFALTSDEEWIMVVQASGPARFHFAILRREVFLLQSSFSVDTVNTLSVRLEQAARELQSGVLHETFHMMARKQGVSLRKPQACKGTCPWVCTGAQFDEACAKYDQKVKQDLRQRGLRLFRSWEAPLVLTP